jgi:hypothetical protein
MNDDFIKRMVKEEEELNARMIALRKFTHTPTFEGLSALDQSLLVVQLSAMASYKETLTMRMARAMNQAMA